MTACYQHALLFFLRFIGFECSHFDNTPSFMLRLTCTFIVFVLSERVYACTSVDDVDKNVIDIYL